MGVMVQSAVNAWLKEKVTRLSTLPTQSKSASIPGVRDLADLRQHCRDDLPLLRRGLQETRLKQDVYYLEKPRRKRKR